MGPCTLPRRACLSHHSPVRPARPVMSCITCSAVGMSRVRVYIQSLGSLCCLWEPLNWDDVQRVSLMSGVLVREEHVEPGSSEREALLYVREHLCGDMYLTVCLPVHCGYSPHKTYSSFKETLQPWISYSLCLHLALTCHELMSGVKLLGTHWMIVSGGLGLWLKLCRVCTGMHPCLL